MPSTRASKSSAQEHRLDRLFGALSNRTRRAILSRLQRKPAKISEIAEPFAMSLPAVSKHLKILERAGLVHRTVDGRVHHCSLDAEPLREADEWLAHYRRFWSEKLESLASYVADR